MLATLSDVAVERQVEITGPDAAAVCADADAAQPLRLCAVGQCKYVLITNARGRGAQRPDPAAIWRKIIFGCRSQTAIFCSGLRAWLFTPAYGCQRLRARCLAPPAAGTPLGRYYAEPLWRSESMICVTTGSRNLSSMAFRLIVSRTGWSSELGYELYLRDGSRGDELWERIMAAGQPFGLQPGHTSAIRRIEGGMLVLSR